MELDYRLRASWPSLDSSLSTAATCATRSPPGLGAFANILSSKPLTSAADSSALSASKILSSARQLLAQQQELHCEATSQFHSNNAASQLRIPAADITAHPDSVAASLAEMDSQAQHLRAVRIAELRRCAAAAGVTESADAVHGPAKCIDEGSAESVSGMDGNCQHEDIHDEQPQGAATDGKHTASNHTADSNTTQDPVLQSAQPGHSHQEEREEDEEEEEEDEEDEAGGAVKVEAGCLAKRKRTPLPMVVDEDGHTRQLTPKEHRRLRRRITNRESAHRMRAKRQEELDSVQREASALGDENSQLRTYIKQLEKDQRSLAVELVGWQNRWKSTTANNVRLCHQLVNLQQQKSALFDTYAMPPPSAPMNRLMTAPSAPEPSLQGLGPCSGCNTGLMRASSESSPLDLLLPCMNMPHSSMAAPPYQDQLQSALSTIFGARDDALDDPSADVLSGDILSPLSKSSLGMR